MLLFFYKEVSAVDLLYTQGKLACSVSLMCYRMLTLFVCLPVLSLPFTLFTPTPLVFLIALGADVDSRIAK